MTDADRIIAAVRSRGSDARDLRDAAHEAYHALRAGVRPGRWDRESIHRAVLRECNCRAVRQHGLASHEIGARAVEQIVCNRLGVDCGTVEHWALVSCMEGIKHGLIQFPDVDWLAVRVREWMTKPAIIKVADEIMALEPVAARRQRKHNASTALKEPTP